MSDTIVQECNMCHHETDCIAGLCLDCRLRRDSDKELDKAYDNIGKMIRTPIGFHTDDCSGCMDVYFSREKQELIAVCNECGLRRQFLTNIEGTDGCIFGATIPFKENKNDSDN